MYRPSHKPGSSVFIIAAFFLAFISPMIGVGQAIMTSDSPDREMFQVIRSGCTDKLKNLLSAGVNPNTADDAFTVLMAAALNGTVLPL
ncbi:MAG: hypothetical protein Q8918_03625 [Bacteroidota bacterium]|nr:hypothetical protein [Bacteroidota bacterium]MDP4211082.1 hypothetical protein [Bacteroidota bacterium]MDP4249183.1 hypothetical protein [Bacteroidota bacterium]